MKVTYMIRSCLAVALGWLLFAPVVVNAAPSDHTNAPAPPENHRDSRVEIGRDVVVNAGETAEDVVVIGGSAKLLGDVRQDVVVIGGDAEIQGDVAGDVVIVMGDAHLGPKAVVHGDLVTVGGGANLENGAKVHGDTQVIGMAGGPRSFLRLEWLRDWFRECVMELRPLAPSVGWVWWFAGTLFLVYWLIVVLFPHPVQSCVNQLSERPATTLAVGILAHLALPIVLLILVFTCIGLLVIPFLMVAVFLALLVGKVAILQYLGGKLAGPFSLKPGQTPVFAFLIGAVFITLLYMVPVIGFLTLAGVSLWGFGATVTAACVALRRERPPLAPVPPSGFVPPAPGANLSAPDEPPLTPPHALAFPRAGFWERMGAGFLDIAVICLSVALAGPFSLLVGLAYFAGMWAWKGTTIGGIVLNLQVVRQDGQPMNFLTALVRSVAAVFSALMLFLGFFWIAWDREKQGWHDKIAGTVVVRLPKPISLVCL